jgi:lipopolysaccharide transport system ATP-binding protein
MEDVANQGRTVIFVSHNMSMIQTLCNKGIVLVGGKIAFAGETSSAVQYYSNLNFKTSRFGEDGFVDLAPQREKLMKCELFQKIRLFDKNGVSRTNFAMLESMNLEIILNDSFREPNLNYGIGILNCDGQIISSFGNLLMLPNCSCTNPKAIKLHIPAIRLSPDRYYVRISATRHQFGEWIDHIDNAISFEIEPTNVYNSGHPYLKQYGLIMHEGEFILS